MATPFRPQISFLRSFCLVLMALRFVLREPRDERDTEVRDWRTEVRPKGGSPLALVLQADGGGDAGLVAEGDCGVTFARGVLDEAGVAGAEDLPSAVFEADLEAAGEDDDELALGGGVPVLKDAGLPGTEAHGRDL